MYIRETDMPMLLLQNVHMCTQSHVYEWRFVPMLRKIYALIRSSAISVFLFFFCLLSSEHNNILGENVQRETQTVTPLSINIAGIAEAGGDRYGQGQWRQTMGSSSSVRIQSVNSNNIDVIMPWTWIYWKNAQHRRSEREAFTWCVHDDVFGVWHRSENDAREARLTVKSGRRPCEYNADAQRHTTSQPESQTNILCLCVLSSWIWEPISPHNWKMSNTIFWYVSISPPAMTYIWCVQNTQFIVIFLCVIFV